MTSNGHPDLMMNHYTSMHYANKNRTSIDVENIVNRFDERIQRRYRIYSRVLELCHERIRKATNKFKYSCVYILPAVVYGMPLTKKTECLCYLFVKLRKDGLECEFKQPNIVQISWEKLVKSKLKDRYKTLTQGKNKQVKKKKSPSPKPVLKPVKVEPAMLGISIPPEKMTCQEHFLTGFDRCFDQLTRGKSDFPNKDN